MKNIRKIVKEIMTESIQTSLPKEYYDWFDNLWDNNADMYEWYELAHTINPDLSFREWEHAWQYLNIDNPVKNQARKEFMMGALGRY